MCAVLFVRLAAKGKYTLMAIRLAHKVIYGTDMMEKVIKIERCIKLYNDTKKLLHKNAA